MTVVEKGGAEETSRTHIEETPDIRNQAKSRWEYDPRGSGGWVGVVWIGGGVRGEGGRWGSTIIRWNTRGGKKRTL